MGRIATCFRKMKFSVILNNGKIVCFQCKAEAIRHAKQNGARAYEWGYVIYGQLRLDFRREI